MTFVVFVVGVVLISLGSFYGFVWKHLIRWIVFPLVGTILILVSVINYSQIPSNVEFLFIFTTVIISYFVMGPVIYLIFKMLRKKEF